MGGVFVQGCCAPDYFDQNFLILNPTDTYGRQLDDSTTSINFLALEIHLSTNSGTSSELIDTRACIDSTFHASRNNCARVDRGHSLEGLCRAGRTCKRYCCAPMAHTWCSLETCPRYFHRSVRAITKIDNN